MFQVFQDVSGSGCAPGGEEVVGVVVGGRKKGRKNSKGVVRRGNRVSRRRTGQFI